MDYPDVSFSTVKLEQLYSDNLLVQKSLDIFLDRFKITHGNFQDSDILSAPIIEDLSRVMLMTAERLNYPITDNEEDRDRILENYGVMILACINTNSDGERFGRKSDEVKGHLQIDTLRILSSAEVVSSIQTRDLKEVIYFCISGKLGEYLIDDFLEKFAGRLTHLNNNLYQRIMNNTFVDKIEEVHYLKFEEHRISFVYYDRYLALDEYCQDEFWKWIILRYATNIKNPAKLFFEAYDDIVIDRGLGFRRLVARRTAIENKIDINLSRTASGRVYIIDEEIHDREIDLLRYNKKIYARANPDNPTVDNHHLFFPRSQYSSDNILYKFINSRANRVDIIKNTHRNMNTYFATDMKHYMPPHLTRELVDQINRFRQFYNNDYKNFVGLQIAVLHVAREFENEMIGLLALDIYDLLRLQSRFITPQTVKP